MTASVASELLMGKKTIRIKVIIRTLDIRLVITTVGTKAILIQLISVSDSQNIANRVKSNPRAA